MTNLYYALSPYELRHVVFHLIAADSTDRACLILTELFYLEAKVEAGLVISLLEEFSFTLASELQDQSYRLVLTRLRDALKREADFVSRHPPMLFQSLWNIACPGRAVSGDRILSLTPQQKSMDRNERETLHHHDLGTLLQKWRSRVRAQARVWLRSLRPPRIGLGAGERMLIPCLGQRFSESVSFAPDSRNVIDSRDAAVMEWNARTGAEERSYHNAEPAETHPICIACSPNGLWIAAADQAHKITTWSRTDGHMAHVLQQNDYVRAISFSADSKYLVVCCSNGALGCWSINSGDLLKTASLLDSGLGSAERERRRSHEFLSLAMLPDGQHVAVPRATGTVEIWNFVDGIKRLSLTGHEIRVAGCVVSLDGHCVITSSPDRSIRNWDVKNGGREMSRIQEDDGAVGTCALSPDGQMIAYAKGQTIQFLNRQTGTKRGAMLVSNFARSLAFAPDGSQIAVGLLSGDIELLWMTRLEQDQPASDAAEFVEMMVFHPHERLLAVASSSGVQVWDVTTGTRGEGQYDLGMRAYLVSWSPNGSKIVAAGTATEFPSFGLRGRYDAWTSMLPDRDDVHVMIHGLARVRVWNRGGGTPIAEQEFELSEITAVALSWDGARLAIASGDGRIGVFEITPMDGRSGLVRTLVIEHTVGRLLSLAFSPDGALLAGGGGYYSASDQAVVCIWDVGPGAAEKQLEVAVGDFCLDPEDRSFGLLKQRLTGHSVAITRLLFSSDGRWLASGSPLEPAMLWGLPDGGLVRKSSAPTDPAILLMRPEDCRVYLADGGTDLEVRADGGTNPHGWLRKRGREFKAVVDMSGRLWAIDEGNQIGLYSLEIPPVSASTT